MKRSKKKNHQKKNYFIVFKNLVLETVKYKNNNMEVDCS